MTSYSTSSKLQKQILIIEDNPDQWVIIQAALQQSFPGVHPVWLTGVEQTLDYVSSCQAGKSETPVLIFLDWYLPERSQGLQVLRALKAKASPLLKVPVVVLSVSVDKEDINQTYSHGSSSFIIKPQTLEQWITCFQTMTHYWWNVVTLPESINRY